MFAIAPCALRLAIPITSSDRFGRKHRRPKGIQRPPDRYRRLDFFAPLRSWPTKSWRSLLCVSFPPLRLCVSFLHFELTRPSCLVVTCIFPAPYTRSCHQLHYPGLSTQITSRLAIAITGARASFPLRLHLASVKAQGRGESKPVDAGMFPSMVFVWLLPHTGRRRST
jgi:hypothetical protein